MGSDSKYERYAERIALFNGLDAKDVSNILHQGQIVEFQKGKTIFHQGQLGSNLFIVLHGRVAIYNKDLFIGVCKVGDAFGEMSVLDHRPHFASAVAKTDVRLFTLSEQQLNQLLSKGIAVRLLLNVIHILSGHLETTNTLVSRQDTFIKELSTQLKALGVEPVVGHATSESRAD